MFWSRETCWLLTGSISETAGAAEGRQRFHTATFVIQVKQGQTSKHTATPAWAGWRGSAKGHHQFHPG